MAEDQVDVVQLHALEGRLQALVEVLAREAARVAAQAASDELEPEPEPELLCLHRVAAPAAAEEDLRRDDQVVALPRAFLHAQLDGRAHDGLGDAAAAICAARFLRPRGRRRHALHLHASALSKKLMPCT